MYKVLVADDKEAFRRKIKRMAYFQNNRDKFEICFEAQNGLESLALLRSNHIDVVLTDIRMPYIDGIALLKKINAEGLCKCVILLSEFAEFSYAKEGILNRAFDYILKPIDEEKIRESFDRAYTYLNTASDHTATNGKKIEMLAEYIISGSRMNVSAYISHMAESIQDQTSSSEERLLQFNMVFAQLKAALLSKSPFLENYISFDDKLRHAQSELAHTDFVTCATDIIIQLADEVSVFSPVMSAKNESVLAVCNQILANPDENINFQRLADRLFVNGKYLSSLMKKDIDQTAVEFITFVKIQRAKFLLSNTDIPVGEMALSLGYHDINYFSRVFKQATTLSPREFRKGFDNCDRRQL